MDFLKVSNEAKIDQFLNTLHSFGFLPVITVPTRITEHSATLLDNFFINFTKNDYQTYAIYEDTSDHLPILLNINIHNFKKALLSTNRNDILTQNYVFSNSNYSSFQNAIANENWSFFSENNLKSITPNESYDHFFSKFKNHFTQSFSNTNQSLLLNSNFKNPINLG